MSKPLRIFTSWFSAVYLNRVLVMIVYIVDKHLIISQEKGSYLMFFRG